MQSQTLDTLASARIFFKCECFQKAGAFKARGAHNAVFLLSDDEAAKGVVTHSSGNHAAALALAASNRRIPAYTVIPSNAPGIKIESIRRLGGKIIFCEPTQESREATAAKVMEETGAQLVHPYNDDRIIAGQGTAALELLEDFPDLDALVTPVGGGGLLSGSAIVAKSVGRNVRVYGAEPAAADDASCSFRAGRLVRGTPAATIADGLRATLGEKTFAVIRTHVDGIVTVTEESIVEALRLTMDILKIVIEPSAAVAVAALIQGKLPTQHRRIGVILSGGNVELDKIPWRATGGRPGAAS